MKYHFTKEQIKEAVSKSTTKKEMMEHLGLGQSRYTALYKKINMHIDEFDIDISHFKKRTDNAQAKLRIPLSEILAGLHPDYQTFKLHKRLIREGIFERRCSRCFLAEWQERPIPLELNHKNGKSWDHRLDNLELLCRNCHGLTDTFAGKNKK